MGDTDFPTRLGNQMASNPAGYLQMCVQGMRGHEQAGTGIPNFRVQQEYAQQEGGPLMQNYEVSGNPSFDLKMPYISGRQSFKGIPNATPEMALNLSNIFN